MKTRRRQERELSLLHVEHDRVAVPIARMSHPAVIDVTISEWTADLCGPSLASARAVNRSAAGSDYVDFDTVDSVHETVTPVARARALTRLARRRGLRGLPAG